MWYSEVLELSFFDWRIYKVLRFTLENTFVSVPWQEVDFQRH